jgi:hypothetical protein
MGKRKKKKDNKLWKELIRQLSVDGQTTKTVLAQKCQRVYVIRQASDTMFAIFLFRDRLRTMV